MKIKANTMNEIMNAFKSFEEMLKDNFSIDNVIIKDNIKMDKYDMYVFYDINNIDPIDVVYMAVEEDGYVRLKINGGHYTRDDIETEKNKEENFIRKLQLQGFLEWFDKYCE